MLASFSPKRILLPALIVALIFFAGCGATSKFDLGIPVSKSKSFFFHMKSAALSYGYSASINHENRTLQIGTRSGNLTYGANDYGNGLQVVLSSKIHQNNKSMEQRWLQNLEESHDKILAKARMLSKANQDWN